MTKAKTSWKRRVFFLCVVAVAMVTSLYAYAMRNHNREPVIRSHEAMVERIDAGIRENLDWLKGNAAFMDENQNPALLHMVKSMASLNPGPILTRILGDFRLRSAHSFWQRMIDPNANTAPLSTQQRADLLEYQRWFAYAVDPGGTPLSEEDKASLWDPERHVQYDLTHQLFAHYFYLIQNRHDEKSKRFITHLAKRVVAEANVDFKVTDLYHQRIACLLIIGRPDLVKPRWVERVLENQLADGGWRWTWSGWGPKWHVFGNPREPSHPHPTIQAAWLLYQIRYGYPEWIAKHYSSKG